MICSPERHVWTAWTSERRSIDTLDDAIYVFTRECTLCGAHEDAGYERNEEPPRWPPI